nr:hypothetical protein [Clostridium botulinum]
MCVSINGKIIDANDFSIEINGQGFNYGYGVFETLKVVNGKIFLWKSIFKDLLKGAIN